MLEFSVPMKPIVLPSFLPWIWHLHHHHGTLRMSYLSGGHDLFPCAQLRGLHCWPERQSQPGPSMKSSTWTYWQLWPTQPVWLALGSWDGTAWLVDGSGPLWWSPPQQKKGKAMGWPVVFPSPWRDGDAWDQQEEREDTFVVKEW